MTAITRLPGYELVIPLYVGTHSIVYRGIRQRDSRPVAIKVLRNPFPSFNELMRFRNQYTITHNLHLPGVITPLALEPYANGYALVMEDFGGISLRQYAQGHPPPLQQTLAIADSLADSLHGLYQHRVVHKDINPANILIQPDTQLVKLIDFGIASLLPKETQEIRNPNILEGTLAYLAPEQTGRMNRGIDYRADFYALGATLYELLTGVLPFQSDNPLELAHCHIAQPPAPPHQINPAIPSVVSAIILKLMAKNAEDRYQNALGLKHDLDQCLRQWRETGDIIEFELGRRDMCDRFQIPEKLYGREKEAHTLLDAFDRISGNPKSKIQNPKSELMLIAGCSGIGKTTVVHEVHKPITQRQGYFIAGKFNQFNRNTPFLAFIQAFQSLIEQLLSESDAELAEWKAAIQAAVGDAGQVIIDLIPELELIIGPQPPVPALSGHEAQNRFNLLLSQFIPVFSTQEHPLVIFLDDAQWADSASLTLLKRLMDQSDTGYLLVLAAYRDNEVFPAHPLMLTLNQMEKQGVAMNTLRLGPLEEREITRLVADTLRCSMESAAPLSQLVYQKTQGNPFFTTQFLQGLYEDSWIWFAPPQSAAKGGWRCDLAEIRQLTFTEDVAAFMASRLRKSAPATQRVLKLAACIGDRFDLATLSVVCEQSQEQVASDLWIGLQERFIVPESETYKFFQGVEPSIDEAEAAAAKYRFLHDRIQQAAYSLISEHQKQTIHSHIGQRLLHTLSPEAREDRIFEIVNHLNCGAALITERHERDELAVLNLSACRKARLGTAYQAALEYAEIGLNLLGDDAWRRQYEFTLKLHEIAAEATAMSGDFDAMDDWINAVIDHGKTRLDQIEIYILKIQVLTTQNKFLEAIACGQSILAKFGVDFPSPVVPAHLQQATKAISALMGNRTVEELLHLPAMVDVEKLAIIKLASRMIPACYLASSPLFPLLASLQVKLSLQYGNSPVSSTGYADYGIFILNVQKDISGGNQFGQLAFRLAATAKDITIPAVTFVPVGLYLHHHQYHLRESLPILQVGYEAALQIGKFEYVGHNIHGFCVNAYWCGQPLAELETQLSAYCQMMLKLNLPTSERYCSIIRKTTLFLLGNPDHLEHSIEKKSGENTETEELLRSHDSTRIFYFYLHRMMVSFLLGEVNLAKLDAIQARQYLAGGATTVCEAGFYFYDSLVALATVPNASTDLAVDLRKIADNQTSLKLWADYAPMNYLHKWQLVEAEKYRVLGHQAEALDLYDQAIAAAKANDYIQEEALANELAAKFYLNWGKEKVAAGYMQAAYYCYFCWGAKAKTDALATHYDHLLCPILQDTRQWPNLLETLETITDPSLPAPAAPDNPDSARGGINSALDFAAVLQASQRLSSTIQLDQLLHQLTQIILQNSGADRCALILPNDGGEWRLEALRTLEQDTEICSIPLTGNVNLPVKLIQYVKNTQDVVVIDDLNTDLPIFDDYLNQASPRSVLCLPILNQGRLIGILALENRATRGVFTHDRILILNFLCTQAAISLKNVRLYQLQQEKTQQLEEKTSQLRLSESRLKQLFEKAADGVMLLSDQGFIDFNQAALKLFRCSNKADLRLAHPAQLSPEFQPDGRRSFDKANALIEIALQKGSHQFEWLHQRLDGECFWAEIMLTAIPYQDEMILHGLVRDISDRKQAEAQIQQYAAQLEDSNQELANFAYSVSHDLRAPLRHMNGFVNTLKRQLEQEGALDNPKVAHYIKTIGDSSRKMGQLIDGLLTLSRIGRKQMNYEWVNMHRLVQEAISLARGERPPATTAQFSVSDLPNVRADIALLQQVFNHLINNAVKFSRLNPNPEVTIGSLPGGTIFVRDNGVGFEMAYADKVFGPFQRLHSQRKFEGVGIGLAIAQRIVHRHGGDIWAEGEPGQGATFYFTLQPHPPQA